MTRRQLLGTETGQGRGWGLTLPCQGRLITRREGQGLGQPWGWGPSGMRAWVLQLPSPSHEVVAGWDLVQTAACPPAWQHHGAQGSHVCDPAAGFPLPWGHSCAGWWSAGQSQECPGKRGSVWPKLSTSNCSHHAGKNGRSKGGLQHCQPQPSAHGG